MLSSIAPLQHGFESAGVLLEAHLRELRTLSQCRRDKTEETPRVFDSGAALLNFLQRPCWGTVAFSSLSREKETDMGLPRGGSHFPKAKETHRSFHRLSGSSMDVFTCLCPPNSSQDLFFPVCPWAAITHTHMLAPMPMPACPPRQQAGLVPSLIPGQGAAKGRLGGVGLPIPCPHLPGAGTEAEAEEVWWDGKPS